MDHAFTEKISAQISDQIHLEQIITQLLSESVSRSDISVQGSAEKIKQKFGVCFIEPQTIQESTYPPTQEPFLNDDFGWVVGFSFALPLFICLIVGIFIVGDIRSTSDNILYGIGGALIGTGVGLFIALRVKRIHDKKLRQQEQQGGFVIWVITHSKKQSTEVVDLMQYHQARNIKFH